MDFFGIRITFGGSRILLKTSEIFDFFLGEHYADPFLFEYANKKYCFYEKKNKGRPGSIYCKRLSIFPFLHRSRRIGFLSKTHKSFPFVFRHQNKIYMIPEASADGGVFLMQSTEFPVRWEKKALLLSGQFVDSIVLYDSSQRPYLMTTMKSKGNYFRRLFILDNGLCVVKEHPSSPVAQGRKSGRLGGATYISQKPSLMLPVQNCSEEYGGALDLYEIKTLSPTKYIEQLVSENYIIGGHHISYLNNVECETFAVDFKFKGSKFRQLTEPIYRSILYYLKLRNNF